MKIHFRGERVVVGLDNLDTEICEYPCQLRRMIKVADPDFNERTYENDLAVITLDAPVTFTDEVLSVHQQCTEASLTVDHHLEFYHLLKDFSFLPCGAPI